MANIQAIRELDIELKLPACTYKKISWCFETATIECKSGCNQQGSLQIGWKLCAGNDGPRFGIE